jgi:rhodanese-related sulfurtransferase
MKRLFLGLIALALMQPVSADTVKGRIQFISKKAQSIQVDVKGGAPQVVRFSKDTAFVNAKGIADLGTKDLIEVEYQPGRPATRITKKVFEVPADMLYRVEDVVALLNKKRGPYTLVDARPADRYAAGHVPTAISIFAKALPAQMDRLPEEKDALLVFYCGGPTCPFSKASAKVVQQHGYTNVKVFNGGMPAWKKAKLPVVASAEWVAQSLDPHHIVIDVRPAAEREQGHIPGAVGLESAKLKAMTAEFIRTRTKAKLPGVSDRGAPIILYDDKELTRATMAAYGELKKWAYKSPTILEGGFSAWRSAGQPVERGPTAEVIRYTKKLKKGAVDPGKFVELEQHRDGVTLLDVRAPKEVKDGVIAGAVHIPLDALEENLDSLPRQDRILTYCTNGIRAEMAYQMLTGKGYEKVNFLNETVEVKPNGSYVIE